MAFPTIPVAPATKILESLFIMLNTLCPPSFRYLSLFMSSISLCIISFTSMERSKVGFQPSLSFALVASPSRKSTSVGLNISDQPQPLLCPPPPDTQGYGMRALRLSRLRHHH